MAQGFASNGNIVITGQVSSFNSTTTPLNASVTFTGTGEDVSIYPSVVVACLTDQAGTLYIEFSPDNTNWDSSLSFSVSANTNEVHRISVTRRYCRIRFTNTSITNQTFLRLQTLLGAQQSLTSSLNSTVQSDADSLVTRSVLMGQTDGGSWKFVPITGEGHLEVSLHDPRLPFGSIHTENLTPVFQSDAVYGVNSGQEETTTSGTGSATAADSNFIVSTGATVFSQAVIQGRKRLRYRAGQGIVGRFAGSFTTGVADSYQVVGFGHSEDGVYFGYKDDEFGILYLNRGVRETRTLTVTVGASVAGSVIITLNGTAYTIAVTNSSNIQRTVWEISQGTYAGWKTYPAGATVVFVRDAAGVTAGAYSFNANGTGSTASIVQTKAGAATTETFVAQADWNGDKLNGSGASGITLNPTLGNVYQIGIQYLGYGAIVFKIEVTPADYNNPDFVTVHTLRLPNTLSTTSFGNPSFPFTMAAYSAGSTTNLTVKVGSFAGFIEGNKVLHGNRFTYFNTLTTVTAGAFHALFTILNTRYYGGRSNQAVINLLSVAGAVKHTQPVIYYLIKGGSLVGNPNFAQLASNSCSLLDTQATTVTYSTGDQVLWTGHLGETGEIDHHFTNGGGLAMEELTLQPGEWITLAARATTGTPAYVTGSINTREDQ